MSKSSKASSSSSSLSSIETARAADEVDVVNEFVSHFGDRRLTRNADEKILSFGSPMVSGTSACGKAKKYMEKGAGNDAAADGAEHLADLRLPPVARRHRHRRRRRGRVRVCNLQTGVSTSVSLSFSDSSSSSSSSSITSSSMEDSIGSSRCSLGSRGKLTVVLHYNRRVHCLYEFN